LEKIQHEGRTLPYPVQVLAFADDEGVRFPTALLGPRSLAGTYDPEVLGMADTEGMLLVQALDAFGGDGAALPSLARVPKDVRAYLEVHIEQGPVLERLDLPVGVVTGICGIERSTVIFTGETGHAGTVPMQGRADALVAAADFIRLVHDEAMDNQDLRATVGTCSVAPNVANGIPDLAQLTLEIRAPSDQAREAFSAQMQARAAECANQRGVTHQVTQTYLQPAVACAPSIQDILSTAVAEAGVEPLNLPSGATHDASAMADLCDIGMLFVRCRGGVSHRPEEFASSADMGVAVEVLARALLSLNQ
ncbi:MAG: hydantoinase/carbamoylase family amidase, partial [Pseudomonadota bacterium]